MNNICTIQEDSEIISYDAVTLKSFNPNGSLIVSNLDTFASKEKIKETYLTQANDVLIRLGEPNITVFIDADRSSIQHWTSNFWRTFFICKREEQRNQQKY